MKFSISKEVFSQLPELTLGLIVTEELNNKGKSKELDNLLSEIAQLVKQNSNPISPQTNLMITPWKTAFYDYEKKPNQTHSSIERLTLEAIKKGKIQLSNKLVNLCNLASLKHTVPIAQFDLDKINDKFSLEKAKGKEYFTDPKTKKRMKITKGELIYVNTFVLARKLDYTESAKAQINEKTTKAIIIIEGIGPVNKTRIEQITSDVQELLEMFCQAKTRTFILNKQDPKIEF